MERDLNSPTPYSDLTRRNANPTPSTRTVAVAWLRKTHGWIGLWGATLGLLFGTSGIWLNHRNVLQLQQAQERSNFQVPLPDTPPVDAQTMAAWLQLTLSLPEQANNIRVEPSKPVPWAERAGKGDHRGDHGDHAAGQGSRGGDAERTRERDLDPGMQRRAADAASASAPMPAPAPPEAAASAAVVATAASAPKVLMQPEHWTINFGGPKATVQAEYWAGNRSVSVRRTENGFIATLTSLHKGIGMPVAWILLVDTLAGSLILLSLSGLALWVLTRRKRTVGFAIFGTALAVTAGLAIAHL